jgi:hypothetical protein
MAENVGGLWGIPWSAWGVGAPAPWPHSGFAPKGLIITNRRFCHKEIVQSFETAEFKLAESGNTTGGHP